ncbi:E3 SUMO-protein ligase ZNF451 isoform X1 [Electrophorus electricus]|uniref:E3 SUMO-protein ligase ZNF451 isoform X1 n=1 Tax=Electrophorus electricus TaxID=8005 RepID=UPI0015D036F5|nr:E3 SUMO-protein ligase ZNF451 isoform X1 [Electrophorus electricus]XP_026879476.2 E3 SUMO-protein ligase ZNF451 isoform X1 [Electrophorus electricus]
MSTSAVTEDAEDDDVEFVSEGLLRPVLECINLVSDGEEDAGVCTVEDQVDRQKAQVVSTLDRLARQVAVEKQERAEKCKAFKEKMISLQAHGRQELAVRRCSNVDSNDAKRCVDIWLKMPGLKPGIITTDTGWRCRSVPNPSFRICPQTCPVINCCRVYDNVPLLEGHLKRFDHSPCDPTITLKGSPACVYACVACGKHFDTKEAWRIHLDAKLSSADASGHVSSQTCQLIVCFACPACYLLFNIRDECLQHMAAKNHFTQFISLGEVKSSTVPIPIPRYAKNRLITLCKDVVFSVKCTACSMVLTSHMEAKAHFNVHCRQGCAIAEANQSIAQVMKQLTVLGHCTSCTKIFLCQRSMEEHREQMQHVVEAVNSVEQALLYYSSSYESRHGLQGQPSKCARATEASPHRERREKSECLWSQTKRQRLSSSASWVDGRALNLAWFCECGLRYMEEEEASKHLLSANQIFHKCAICGKLMGESSIARLHMSRFHGGAHLSNFLFHCRLCKVEMPRMEDIVSHIGVTHRGHTYYQEREDTTEKTSSCPSPNPCSSAADNRPAPTCPAPPPGRKQRWLCRMCEDLFESKAAVHEHCSNVSSHSFQRFACGHCPQKFFKESTLRRHCTNEHGGHLLLRFFCGLCDSMLYDSEHEFQEHYSSLHSRDYYRLEQVENGTSSALKSLVEAPTTSGSLPQLCPCMGSQRADEEQKSLFTRCMKQLAGKGKCEYICRRCTVAVGSYSQIKTHMYLKHGAQGKDKSFDVICALCSERQRDVPSFHSHYHAHHCLLEPCVSSRSSGLSKDAPSGMILNAEEISAGRNAEEFQDVKSIISSSTDVTIENPKGSKGTHDDADEEMKLALALSAEEAKKPTQFDPEMEEALKRSLEEF